MNYEEYQAYLATQPKKENTGGTTSFPKIGFFKLKNDGDMALVRFNVDTLKDIETEAIHTVKTSDSRWTKVKCLNTLGSFEKVCPLCAATAGDKNSDARVTRKCYVKMLVSYKDPTTQAFQTPQPVVWEKGSNLATELGGKLAVYGSLKDQLFLVIRHGKANDKDTSYQIEPAPEKVYAPTMIPNDFSAFENFRIDRHSYWVKTVDEINTFIATGSFPAVEKAETTQATTQQATTQQTNIVAQTQAVAQAEEKPFVTQQQTTVETTATPATEATTAAQSAEQATTVERPKNRFQF